MLKQEMVYVETNAFFYIIDFKMKIYQKKPCMILSNLFNNHHQCLFAIFDFAKIDFSVFDQGVVFDDDKNSRMVGG
ncbi:hypothetical protein ACQZV8_18075, partial [Magnetococcales bacterium HHB-1]